MAQNIISLIDDVHSLGDDVLVRKIIECRREVVALKHFDSDETNRARAKLEKVIRTLEGEAEQRALPRNDSGMFSAKGRQTRNRSK